MYRSRHAAPPREAMILMVVLALLTLFALLGITFVLYSQSAALSARFAKEAQALNVPDVDTEEAFALFLGQFLYGTSDTGSALRGWDLAGNMYGPTGSTVPYGGVGRLHVTNDATDSANPAKGIDDYSLVNFQRFSADGIYVRDPGQADAKGSFWKTSTGTAKAYVGGHNPPYTYPDVNNLYLGLVQGSDGTVLAHSFHRDYNGFGTLAKSNANWTDTTKPYLKYMVLRPRPADHPDPVTGVAGGARGFPFPEDAGGDVKNLLGSPGFLDPITSKVVANDSFWIDVGAPVLTASNGLKYKMLVAPFVADLDGRLNVNAAGNLRGGASAASPSLSNQGWGAWEINPSKVLDGKNGAVLEWPNLFKGRTSPTVAGRYGPDGKPLDGASSASATSVPRPTHYYSQLDYDGTASYNGTSGTVSGSFPPSPPVSGTTTLFPTFPTGYENGSSAELQDHPQLYNAFVPYTNNSSTYDRRFTAQQLERLLRFGDTGYAALSSELERSSPLNFNNPADLTGSARRRRQVTTDSTDRILPGLTPYIFDQSVSGYAPDSTTLEQPPYGPSIAYPSLPLSAPPVASEFGADWRAKAIYTYPSNDASNILLRTALRRINLNRPLTPYPLLKTVSGSPAPNWYNQATAADQAQFKQALADRQQFADDIYRRLLVVAGVAPVTPDPKTPKESDLAPRRWLAQLAVNIVDFIDDDDIITPFQFYTSPVDDKTGTVKPDTYGNAPNNKQTPPVTELPSYWVFGTEMPRVVVNEVMFQTPQAATNTNPNDPVVTAWVELYNTVNDTRAASAIGQKQDTLPIYLLNGDNKATYQIVVAGDTYSNFTTSNDNVLGTANYIKSTTADTDFQQTVKLFKSTGAIPNQASPTPSIAPGGYLLVAPSSTLLATSNKFRDPLTQGSGANTPTIPDNTPFVRTTITAPSYQISGKFGKPNGSGANPPDERVTGLYVYLRRLANPLLPPSTDPTSVLYNPYVTVDYVAVAPILGPDVDGSTAATGWPSRAKAQPYAALTQLSGTDPRVLLGTSPVKVTPNTAPKDPIGLYHTFGFKNQPTPTNYDWLMHLDRQVVSPAELLHVSGYPQHLLTQKFNAPPPTTPAAAPVLHSHRAPWFDQNPVPAGTNSYRLYRMLEFLDAGNRAGGVSAAGGRIPGKINLNTVFDKETFRALCDANASNVFYGSSSTPDSVVDSVFTNLLASRTPKTVTVGTTTYNVPGPTNIASASITAPYTTFDRPFQGMATGFSSASTQFPNGQGIADTLLRPLAGSSPSAGQPALRLFQNPADTIATHPAAQYQLLSKLLNNVTTRSNVFAVWLTVGFFEVTDPKTTPPRLGAEIGRSEGRNVRHRMFAIVDRANLELFRTKYTGTVTVTSPNTYGIAGSTTVTDLSTLLPTTSISDTRTGKTWSVQDGMTLVFDAYTANEEAVLVTLNSSGTFQATFTKTHNTSNGLVIAPGNPGPWTRYDPRSDPVVLHWSVIH